MQIASDGEALVPALEELVSREHPVLIGSAVDADERPRTDEVWLEGFDGEGLACAVRAGTALSSSLRHRRYVSAMGGVVWEGRPAFVGFAGRVHELSQSDLSLRLREAGADADSVLAGGYGSLAGFVLFDGRGILRQDGTEWKFGVGTAEPPATYYVTNSCTGCGICVVACPQLAIDLTKSPVMISQPRCIHCGTCFESCPNHAIIRL